MRQPALMEEDNRPVVGQVGAKLRRRRGKRNKEKRKSETDASR